MLERCNHFEPAKQRAKKPFTPHQAFATAVALAILSTWGEGLVIHGLS
jgi:hypothetical protein